MKKFENFILEIGLTKSAIENYVTFSDASYNTFYIPKKKKGEKRVIDCPNANLKAIQRFFLKKYLNKVEVNKRVNGFVPKRGIKRNALFHMKNKYLLTIDIKDFFPSISQKKVFEVLYEIYYDKDFALKMAKLCTYKRSLPQGAPTSPALSNLVFKGIDDEIMKYCNSEMVNYSRYADDLTFSSDNKNSLQYVYKFVSHLLYTNGFNINKKKTRYLSGKGKMSITGVYINSGKPKVSSELKKQLRAELHQYIINGKEINLNQVSGYISFISSIEDDYLKKVESYIEKLKKKKTLMLTLKAE
ncbi:retron St85 family RNA-directed DNA polymerase [Jiulongibacter sediminis]|uniref:retron St85 family RNA-directed DNA polymerase n=1 Tax=Jiulongibacter sediminis TaxID=1605367 RepID=UPI0006DC8C2C|nr:retron St85 family RNA-directed DNA polymerase [Jiulongibacter sediminis]